MKHVLGLLAACLLAASAAAAEGPSPPAAGAASATGKPSIPAALDRGVTWLVSKQNPDGGYGPPIGLKGSSNVGLTAFALYALARSPRGYKEHDGPFISRAVKFLLERQQGSGAFFDPSDPSLQNYKTSVAVLALLAVDRKKYAAEVGRATAFIRGEQVSEAGGCAKERDVNYGGIGYGSDRTKCDLSNSQFAAEALHEAGLAGSDDLWKRLQVFLARCQNGEADDPLVKAAGVRTSKDGGFRYQPAGTRGNEESLDGDKVYSSYGSMTYAGLKSMLYAQMKKDDPRVQEAFRWISSHFTVEANPGMATAADAAKGLQGLYYYYHTMAKALSIYGEPVVTDEKGVRHEWAKELGERLASLQGPDGSWRNKAERWMESVDVLDTSYALIALTICKETLDPAK
jgi:squalene-hopene/tetraprenyl-beta-curcumene cyclase